MKIKSKRIVKTYETRKNEILDAAQEFFFHKGYDKTTVEDIIGKLHLAKGTFYHYFISKKDLLDALIDRIVLGFQQSAQAVSRSDSSAVAKLNRLFEGIATYKIANLEVLFVFIKVLFRDENAILRDELYRSAADMVLPYYRTIVKQGLREGIFNTRFPDDIARMLIKMGQGLNESMSRMLLDAKLSPADIMKKLKTMQAMYEDAIERILGAPPGSVKIKTAVDYEKMMKKFYKYLRAGRDEVIREHLGKE